MEGNHIAGTREREVGCGCPTNTQTKEEGGKWADLPGLHEARRGRIDMQKVRIGQVLYEQKCGIREKNGKYELGYVTAGVGRRRRWFSDV